MAATPPKYPLEEVVEQLMIRKGNMRLKNFAGYLSMAQDIYKDLYKTILPTIISKYVEVFYDKTTDPHPYILIPNNLQRFYGISITDRKGHLKGVVYNEKINVLTKPPRTKKCGCITNDLCDCLDNLTMTTTEKIINGHKYYEKKWVQVCADGLVLQYSEVPVRKYGFDGGSYSNDYGDDYDIVGEGDNIMTLQFTKILGSVEKKACGCLIDNDKNKKIIYESCAPFLPLKPKSCCDYHKSCDISKGEFQFSECGEKIYLINVHTDDGFVVISYQKDAVKCDEEIYVEEYARAAIWAGIENESTRYFPRASLGEKEYAQINYNREKTKLFEYNNPLNRERFFSSVTAEIKL